MRNAARAATRVNARAGVVRESLFFFLSGLPERTAIALCVYYAAPAAGANGGPLRRHSGRKSGLRRARSTHSMVAQPRSGGMARLTHTQWYASRREFRLRWAHSQTRTDTQTNTHGLFPSVTKVHTPSDLRAIMQTRPALRLFRSHFGFPSFGGAQTASHRKARGGRRHTPGMVGARIHPSHTTFRRCTASFGG